MESIINIGALIAGDDLIALPLAKKNSNIEHDEHDDLLQIYLDAAIEDAENYTGIKIKKREITIDFKDWATVIPITVNPLTVITEISYKDKNGDKQVIAETDYQVAANNFGFEQTLVFSLNSFPVLESENRFPITLVGEVGYTSDDLPTAIKSAILLKFSNKEFYREEMPRNGVDTSFKAALRPYRKW